MENTGEFELRGPRLRGAIIEDARLRARRRRLVFSALLAVVLALVAVVWFSAGGSDGFGASTRAGALERDGANGQSQTVIDGVTVYTAEPKVGPTAYSARPFRHVHPEFNGGFLNTDLTRGDLQGCRYLTEAPGPINQNCALMIAQVRNGDLTPKKGLASVTYTLCGRHPWPGEVHACRGDVMTDGQIDASLARLRRVLRERRASP